MLHYYIINQSTADHLALLYIIYQSTPDRVALLYNQSEYWQITLHYYIINQSIADHNALLPRKLSLGQWPLFGGHRFAGFLCVPNKIKYV